MSPPLAPSDRSVIERTLSILSTFDPGNLTLTVSQISHRSGVPVATVYRIVSKLVSWGALERAEGNSYTIGPRLWEIALLAPRHSALRDAAVPHMLELRAMTRSAVLLSVREGGEGICLERISGGVTPFHRPCTGGRRFPLHATARGHVLLAAADPTVRNALCAGELRACTRRTVTDPSVLRDLVERAGRQGYAVSAGEFLEGVVEVAAPVHDGDGDAVGALGLFTDDRGNDHVRQVVGPLLRTARRISGRLAALARIAG
ncbi:IclR family transcriptional regulator [Streptomyces fuscichromogenes]|uniref:IclR family transcriptional regulator n=1 Tax=Streptomyces fuscichromogenes TaxID=1324013 RepID=UPI00381E6891